MKTHAPSRVPAAGFKHLLLWTCMAAGLAGTAGLIIGTASAQQPPATTAPAGTPPASRGGAGGRSAIPNATPQQTAAITQMNTDLAAAMQALATARADLITAALASPRNDAAVNTKLDVVKSAEVALAKARADALEKIQASPNKLAPNQLAALAAAATRAVPAAKNPIPHITSAQVGLLTQMTGTVQPPMQTLTAARTVAIKAALVSPRNDAAISAGINAVVAAEQDLAHVRADALAAIQHSPHPLAPDQLAALVSLGGVLSAGDFSEPQPLNFNDHEGYVSLFDGVSLKGWDGHPKFWRVEDGAIIGESTPQNPSGNSYIAYKDIQAKDFTLKFEVKVDGVGGSGIQYRSKTGVPWLSGIAPAVTANAGPLNLNWMMTGPQADFWPSKVYTGQFYSENTPMRIMAWRGQVVEGAGMASRRLMGNIGDRDALGKLVKPNDWNQYTVIARGGTLIHIVNGQLMAVMIDDDPASSNNQSGEIGIEIEAVTKVYVRNIWLKKLN